MAETLLISPHGDKIVDLMVSPDEADALRSRVLSIPQLQLSQRAACDLELLATGAFSPLDRFLGQDDYERILGEMRLTSGHIFPIPVTLPIEPTEGLHLDREVALRDASNDLLGVMTIEEIYEWDLPTAAQNVFGTTDMRHPLVAEMHGWGKLNVSGQLKVLQLPRHYDFKELRLAPSATRRALAGLGHNNVVAFQTRNPLHRAHEELTRRAVQETDGVLLLHPVVGMTKPGDIDHYTRVRTYKAFAAGYYDPNRILLSLIPLAMRMAGPREAVWHGLIRRNFGANHLIVGRDHASPGLDSRGKAFYGPYDAQELAQHFSEELGVRIIPFRDLVYLPQEDRYEEVSKVPKHVPVISLSGSRVRDEYLNKGRPLPEWFTRPEAAEILAESYPPVHQQGVCVWFTGLSGAGKSTTAEVLTVLALEHGRQTTLLDGDVVRTNLSQGLGFSKRDRDLNIRRIGFVAAEIVRHGGFVICAAVSPYRATRNDVRTMIGPGQFVEVFVDTPLEVCEQRDAKGMYARARRGELKDFTGIDDPYEPPISADITIDTVNCTAEQNARVILDHLMQLGFVRGQGPSRTDAASLPAE